MTAHEELQVGCRVEALDDVDGAHIRGARGIITQTSPFSVRVQFDQPFYSEHDNVVTSRPWWILASSLRLTQPALTRSSTIGEFLRRHAPLDPALTP